MFFGTKQSLKSAASPHLALCHRWKTSVATKFCFCASFPLTRHDWRFSLITLISSLMASGLFVEDGAEFTFGESLWSIFLQLCSSHSLDLLAAYCGNYCRRKEGGPKPEMDHCSDRTFLLRLNCDGH